MFVNVPTIAQLRLRRTPVTDQFRTEENRPFVPRVDSEAKWMERTGVLVFEDALAQLHTDHVPMAGIILQFRRRTG